MNPYKFVDSNLKLDYSMAEDEIMVEMELGIDSHKYGDEPVILKVQAYWGDDGTRKFGGDGMTTSNNGNTIIIKKVKLTNKRNRRF